jgi:membrane associated rhomboid family serine protease
LATVRGETLADRRGRWKKPDGRTSPAAVGYGMSGLAKAIDKRPAAEGLAEAVKARGRLLGGSVALLWAINLVNTLGGHWLDGLGVHPRSLFGLWGILFAPFLHASWAHLLANTTSLLILGWLVMLRRTRSFLEVAGIAAFTAGLGTWLIGGAASVHIGASGVIFGLLGFLLSRGVFEKKLFSILGSVLGLLVFGGALRGLFPGLSGVSWEGHLFGFLGGILAARLAVGSSPTLAGALSPAGTHARIAPPRERIAEPEPEPEADEALEALKRRMGR